MTRRFLLLLACSFIVMEVNAAPPREMPPVYFAAIQETGGQPVIKFVFAKRIPSTPRFESTHAFRIAPNRATCECNAERTNDLGIPQEYAQRPLYDPADPKRYIPIEKLPVFFATVVSAELTRKGYVKTEDESLLYHTCTRQLWERLLGMRREKK